MFIDKLVYLLDFFLFDRHFDKLDRWDLTTDLSIIPLKGTVELLEKTTLSNTLHVSVLIILGSSSYFSDFFNFAFKLILNLSRPSCKPFILLVATHKDGHFPIQHIQIVDNVIQNLRRLTQLSSIFRVHYQDESIDFTV